MKLKENKVSVLFMLFSVLFSVCLIAANVLETKQIAVGTISLTGGLIVFPVSYIINDCICEVWGYQKARLLIWLGFVMNFFFVLVGALCDAIPGGFLLDKRRGISCHFRLSTAHSNSVFCGFFVWFVCKCLCNESHENSF